MAAAVHQPCLGYLPSLCRIDSSSPGRCPDYHFRCAYCIKFIDEDSPVYMRHDTCYCSPRCRDKGLSRLYTNLKESQLQEMGKYSSGGTLATSGNIKSESSITSRATTCIDDHAEGGRLGPLARLGQRVIDVLLQRVASQAWGAQALRTYSSGMLWGRELVKDTSARALFSFLPEVDHYIRKGDSCAAPHYASQSQISNLGSSDVLAQ
mmetsp:Transcript_82348/g.218503  ORF Transcript_82348/g.218503 Transcript_82348/m.218503 type:complete len:208 (-) Transcript_82348:155-778(-)